MVFWQPILQGRREQERLIEVAHSKALVHALMVAALLRNVKYFVILLTPTGSQADGFPPDGFPPGFRPLVSCALAQFLAEHERCRVGDLRNDLSECWILQI